MCSTPYGIKGMSSIHSCLCFSGQTRAQRLTASKVCPVSIQQPWAWAVFVLNALRHQRYVQPRLEGKDYAIRACSTPYGIKGMSRNSAAHCRPKSLSAQRLTASKVCPGSKRNRIFFVFCGAQRLTASKVCPVGGNVAGENMFRVLNALRHQRYVQEAPEGRPAPQSKVLNALRHQRYVQDNSAVGAVVTFGVLNALRHQRYVQQGIVVASSVIRIVLNALRHQRYVQALAGAGTGATVCAQRLTASKVCPEIVANQSARLALSAQRLTASKVCPGAIGDGLYR